MAERTTHYGITQQGPTNERPTNAYDGFSYYDTTLRELIVWDATIKNWFSASGRALYSASSPRMLSDDFKGADLDARYSLNEGNDDVAALPALRAGVHHGEMRLTTGNAGTGTAADGSVWGGPAACWEAEEGQITLTVRAKISAITDVAFFIGLTDTLPASTLEMPATLAVATYTTIATDAVGFLFDTAATTDTLRAVGVKNDVDATHVDTAVAPVADTYKVFKLAVDVAGTARFYLDGVLKATVENAVSPGVDLVPIIIAEARAAAGRTMDVDYVSCV